MRRENPTRNALLVIVTPTHRMRNLPHVLVHLQLLQLLRTRSSSLIAPACGRLTAR